MRGILEDRGTTILHALLAARPSRETLVAVRIWERERKRRERHYTDEKLLHFLPFYEEKVRIMLYFVAAVFVILIYFFCGF